MSQSIIRGENQSREYLLYVFLPVFNYGAVEYAAAATAVIVVGYVFVCVRLRST